MLRTKKYNNEAASYPYVSAIIVAAGNSTRMGGVNKQFLLIDGVPVLIRTLKAFENSDLIKEIIISAREEDIPQIFAMVKDYSVNKVSNIVKGGCTRQESVFNAVRGCMTEADYIAIHDGARPLVDRETIEKTIFAAFDFNAAAPGAALAHPFFGLATPPPPRVFFFFFFFAWLVTRQTGYYTGSRRIRPVPGGFHGYPVR